MPYTGRMKPEYSPDRLGYTFPFMRDHMFVTDDYGSACRVPIYLFDAWWQDV